MNLKLKDPNISVRFKSDLSHFLIIGLAPKPNLRVGPNKNMTLWKPFYLVCVLIAK